MGDSMPASDSGGRFKGVVHKIRLLTDDPLVAGMRAFMKAGNVEIKVGTHKNVVAMVLYVPAGERARYLSSVVETIWEGHVPEMPDFLQGSRIAVLRGPKDPSVGGDAGTHFQNVDAEAHPDLLIRHARFNNPSPGEPGASLMLRSTCTSAEYERVTRLRTAPYLPRRQHTDILRHPSRFRYQGSKYDILEPLLVPHEADVLEAFAEEVQYYNSTVRSHSDLMVVYSGEVVWRSSAATTIQSTVRSWLGRRKASPPLAHRMLRHHAAVRIQRFFRSRWTVRRMRAFKYLSDIVHQVGNHKELYLTSRELDRLRLFVETGGDTRPNRLGLLDTVYAYTQTGCAVTVSERPPHSVPVSWVPGGPKFCERPGLPQWLGLDMPMYTPEQAKHARVLSVHDGGNVGHLLLSYCLLEEVIIMGQDAAPSLRGATDNRPETRVVFSSAEEARRRAVLLGALTYDEREGRGVTLVSLVPDVLAMMNVVPHGMSREQADKAFTQHDRWHLWEMEKRRINKFMERHMAHSSLRPFVTRMLLEASPLRPSAPGLSDIMRREAGGYELVFVPRELKKGVMDVTEAASRLASLGLEPSDFLKDALSGQDLSKSRVYASLVPRWRAGWVPTAAQRKTIAKEELEDLSRRLQAEASKNGAASYSRETNEATRVGQLLGPRTELTEVEEKQRKQLEEQDRLAAKVAALGAGGEVSKGSLPDAPSELTVTSRKNKGAVVPQRPSSATARRVRSGKEQEVGGEASAVSLFAEISLSSMGSDAEEAEEEDSAAEVAPSAQGQTRERNGSRVASTPEVMTVRDMLREYRAEQARVVREIKAQWQLSRTNQLVAAMADKLVKAERVRQAEPLPVRALDVDYLRYTAAGNEVACTADSNAQARSMRHQWRQEGRAVVEREHASKTAQRINIAEMAARRRTMAQTWRQDEKIIAEAKRDTRAAKEMQAKQDRVLLARQRREMRQERHAGRHYSAAFSRTLVAFTRKIQRAEEASVSGQAREEARARVQEAKDFAEMRNASARAFVKAAAQTRALEVKQAREENERERQGERSERIMALRQAAELLKMSQVAARGHLGPGGTKMMWAYAREPFPIANVVSVAEAEQVASGSTNEAPPPAVPFAGEGRDEFPGRAYPIPVVKALEGRVRVVGDPMSHGGDHGAYGDTGLGHGEWGRRSASTELRDRVARHRAETEWIRGKGTLSADYTANGSLSRGRSMSGAGQADWDTGLTEGRGLGAQDMAEGLHVDAAQGLNAEASEIMGAIPEVVQLSGGHDRDTPLYARNHSGLEGWTPKSGRARLSQDEREARAGEPGGGKASHHERDVHGGAPVGGKAPDRTPRVVGPAAGLID